MVLVNTYNYLTLNFKFWVALLVEFDDDMVAGFDLSCYHHLRDRMAQLLTDDTENGTCTVLLVDDDEGNETDAHDAAEDLAAEAHVEGFEDAPGNVHDKERPEDADDVGAFQHAIELVNEEGNDEYVEDVNDAYCWKLEHVNSF